MTAQRFFGISALTLYVGFTLSLVGCGRGGEIAPLPQGEQTVSGTLSPVPISKSRNGTHALYQDGKQLYFVESSTIALRSLEGRLVVLKGTVAANVDPRDLPVLRVTEVVSGDMALKQVSIPSLKLKLSIPGDWQIQIGDGARFTASGSTRPILLVQRSATNQMPQGDSTNIAGSRAVIVTLGDTDQIAYVDRGSNTIISFAFAPGTQLDDVDVFRRILSSVTFEGHVSSAKTGSGSAQGIPCGGPAGILCPEGQYCEVTDAGEDIGRCVRLQGVYDNTPPSCDCLTRAVV